MKIWMGNKEQGRAITGGDFEEERVGDRGHPRRRRATNSPTRAEGTIQCST